MKKLTYLFLICSSISFAQSFHKNALVFDVNGGIDIYNTKLSVHNKNNGTDTVLNDKAGNFNYHLGMEYGLHKNFGLGIRYRGSNYFVDNDSTKSGESIKSNDVLLMMNYHPYSSKGFDLVLGGDIGLSSIKFNIGDKEGTKLWDNGLSYSFYLNPRLYIGRFGFNGKLSLPFYNYSSLDSNNEQFNKDQSYKLSGLPGWSFSLGIQFRFLKEKKSEEETKKETKKD